MSIIFPTNPTSNQLYSVGTKTWMWNGYAWDLVTSNTTIPTVLNDISNQFDGTKTVFNLNVNQDNINTIVDSKDLEVLINGIKLNPYVDVYTYPWLIAYDAQKGYRVINVPSDTDASITTGKVIIYDSPFIGDSSTLIYRPLTLTRQKRKYPFDAITIALGD